MTYVIMLEIENCVLCHSMIILICPFSIYSYKDWAILVNKFTKCILIILNRSEIKCMFLINKIYMSNQVQYQLSQSQPLKITQILFNDSHIGGEHLQLPPLTVKQWPPVVLLRSGERCLPIASTPMWKWALTGGRRKSWGCTGAPCCVSWRRKMRMMSCKCLIIDWSFIIW